MIWSTLKYQFTLPGLFACGCKNIDATIKKKMKCMFQKYHITTVRASFNIFRCSPSSNACHILEGTLILALIFWWGVGSTVWKQMRGCRPGIVEALWEDTCTWLPTIHRERDWSTVNSRYCWIHSKFTPTLPKSLFIVFVKWLNKGYPK